MDGYPGQVCQMENPQDSGLWGGQGYNNEPYPFGISPFGSEAAVFDTVALVRICKTFCFVFFACFHAFHFP